MDMSLLAILWVVILIVQAVTDKKKKKLPSVPPSESAGNADFDIPTLANDPNLPEENVKSAEVREINFSETYHQNKSAREKISARALENNLQTATNEKNKNLPLNLNAESAMNAMILSEIFGKPKALRRKF